ncbi:MAG: YifB family Mg chelatase-like AAA ATPase [Patescibacteria group bacterium]|nr:YifB family Mg chelatase-like AAA ATPase [Patescibacteria group bacterium]
MSLAKCYSAHLCGLTAEMITVEVDISNGLNALSVVGLGDRAVEEAKDRVSAAVKNSGFVSPKQKNQKTVISLAPADVRKEGASFDLAMALAYLSASGEVIIDPEKTLFLGELALDGQLRRVPGILPILCQMRDAGFTRAFIPADNSVEASLAEGIKVYGISSIGQAVSFFNGEDILEPIGYADITSGGSSADVSLPDMSVIRGNDAAKRGLLIAAAGGHNILMYGPPGTGKTMLARSFPTILPPLTASQSVEVTGIHSAARAFFDKLIVKPPFRAPHHTASYPAVVGGGVFPKPGEITLAHRGVLFLDELPEFDRSVLEALRQPLEERSITISRAKGSMVFPADCVLIASMNPCPCGKSKSRGCTCSVREVRTYRRRISGPIMDRLDITVNVNKVDYARMAATVSDAESSDSMRSKVIAARAVQEARFKLRGIDKKLNSEMDAGDIGGLIVMDDQARSSLTSAGQRLDLSGRAFHRIIKVARTIADVDGSEQICGPHIMEAIQYRQHFID